MVVQSGKRTEKVTEREVETARQLMGCGRPCTMSIGLPTLDCGNHFAVYTCIETPDYIP